MKKSNQSGFALVEALLIILLMAVIAGTGYYVWHTKQTASQTYEPVTTGTTPNVAQPKRITDPLASKWLNYEAPGKEYSIRLADGWKLSHCKGTADLYTYGNANVHYQPGTAATVTTIDCGSDGGAEGIFITYFAKQSDVVGKTPGNASGIVTTVQSVPLQKYVYTETGDVDGLGGVDKGGKIYSYVGTKDGHTILVEYGVDSHSTDEHETVETVLKTIQFLK